MIKFPISGTKIYFRLISTEYYTRVAMRKITMDKCWGWDGRVRKSNACYGKSKARNKGNEIGAMENDHMIENKRVNEELFTKSFEK